MTLPVTIPPSSPSLRKGKCGGDAPRAIFCSTTEEMLRRRNAAFRDILCGASAPIPTRRATTVPRSLSTRCAGGWKDPVMTSWSAWGSVE